MHFFFTDKKTLGSYGLILNGEMNYLSNYIKRNIVKNNVDSNISAVIQINAIGGSKTENNNNGKINEEINTFRIISPTSSITSMTDHINPINSIKSINSDSPPLLINKSTTESPLNIKDWLVKRLNSRARDDFIPQKEKLLDALMSFNYLMYEAVGSLHEVGHESRFYFVF